MKTWSRNYGTTRCIKIDLLAPGRDEELMRRNNPVKHAVWIAGFCVIAVLIWMLKLRQDIRSSRADFTAAESQFMGIKNKFELVKDTQGRADEVEHKIAELDRLVTNRFLWAPLLNTVENIKVEGIHFTRISGDQQYTYEGSRSVVGPHWVETFTPAAMVESVRLSIEARDQSADQHALIQYRNSLNKCSYILKDLNCPECFTLDATLTPAAAGASNQTGRFIVFDLVARFPEVRRNE